MEPTYTTTEILQRIENCTSVRELIEYGKLINEEKKRYCLVDLRNILQAYTEKKYYFEIMIWLKQ